MPCVHDDMLLAFRICTLESRTVMPFTKAKAGQKTSLTVNES